MAPPSNNGCNLDTEYLGSEALDIQKYWRILYRHKWKIILSSLLFGAAAAATLLVPAPRYQATAILSFEGEQANLVDIEQVYETNRRNRDYLKTQAQLIRSRSIMDRVANRLHRANPVEQEADPEPVIEEISSGVGEASAADASVETGAAQLQTGLNEVSSQPVADAAHSPVSDSEGGNDRVTAILKNLTVENIRNTQLIKVTFESQSREWSALVANTIAEEYIDSQREVEEQVTLRATSWLNERLSTAEGKLQESERNLREFIRQEELVDIDGILSISEGALNEVSEQMLEARRQTQRLWEIRSVVQQSGTDMESLMKLPTLQRHPDIQGLRRSELSVEQNISELGMRYGIKHPKMISENTELESIRSQINREVQQVVDGIEGEYQAAVNRESRLRSEFERLKTEHRNISETESRYQELKRKVEIDRGLYDTFLTRVKETDEIGGFDTPAARLADPALPPNRPVEVKIELFLAIALAAGLVLGSVAVVLFELLYDVVRSPGDVESALGQSLFGVMPLLQSDNGKPPPLRCYFDKDNYSFSEAVRTLRTSIVLSNLDTPAKIVAITSSVPAEGKTTVSQCLAFSLAQMERVLLIDADLRRPVIGRNFGFSAKRPGLTSLLMGRKKAGECIYADAETGLHIMPSGPLPPDAQKLLGSVGFANQVKLLSEHYDRIIIDTPPVQAVSDALMVSRHAHSTLYVIKSESTRRRIVRKGIERFSQVGSRIDGVILSQVDLSANAEYTSEYYGYYGDKYGYGAPDTGASDNDGEADESVDVQAVNDRSDLPSLTERRAREREIA